MTGPATTAPAPADPVAADAPPPIARNRDFRRLWAAQAVSAFGSRITRTAIPVVAIVLLGAGPAEVALLATLEFLPEVAVGLLAGGFVDRTLKRRLLILADLARAVLVLAIPVAAWAGVLGMPLLYGAVFAIGIGTALFQLADGAFLPVVLSRGDLVAGNARLATTDSVAEIGGPGLAGLLIEWIGAPFALVADAASYLWSAALLAGVRRREQPAAPDGPTVAPLAALVADLRAGAQAVRARIEVAAPVVAFAVADLFNGFFMSLYMLYALQTLALSPGVLGLVIGAGGVGALAGALLAGWLGRRLGIGPAMLLAMLVGKGAAISLPMAAWWPAWAVELLLVQQVVGDAFMVACFVLVTSTRQALLPQDLLARSGGLLQALRGVLLPAGAFAAAGIAAAFGTATAILVGVLGGIAACSALAHPRLLRLRTLGPAAPAT